MSPAASAAMSLMKVNRSDLNRVTAAASRAACSESKLASSKMAVRGPRFLGIKPVSMPFRDRANNVYVDGSARQHCHWQAAGTAALAKPIELLLSVSTGCAEGTEDQNGTLR